MDTGFQPFSQKSFSLKTLSKGETGAAGGGHSLQSPASGGEEEPPERRGLRPPGPPGACGPPPSAGRLPPPVNMGERGSARPFSGLLGSFFNQGGGEVAGGQRGLSTGRLRPVGKVSVVHGLPPGAGRRPRGPQVRPTLFSPCAVRRTSLGGAAFIAAARRRAGAVRPGAARTSPGRCGRSLRRACSPSRRSSRLG